MRLILALCAVLVGAAIPASDIVYQYAVPSSNAKGEAISAYLWVPPKAERIRGLLVGGQVLFEGHFAAHPAIRAACAEQAIGIVYFQPHLDAVFADGTGPRLEKALADLAAASGRSEVATAPLMPYGHSVGTIWSRNLLFWKPQRCFGAIFFKGGFGVPDGHTLAEVVGIPLIHLQGRFEEFGPGPSGALREDEDRSTGGRTAQRELLALRAQEPRFLMSLLVEDGSTHFALNDRAAERLAAFVRSAAAKRIPAAAAAADVDALVAVDPASGAYSDGELWAPKTPPAAAAEYPGAPAAAFWHCDVALAQAADAFHAVATGKQAQFVSFADGKGMPLGVGHDMRLKMQPQWNGPDTFKATGAYWTTVPKKYPAVDGVVGHAAGPVQVRVFSGPLQQIAPDTFRVTMDLRCGPRPFLLAFHPGDATWRTCEQPGNVGVPLKLTKGKAQVITFAPPAEVKASDLPLTLSATSDASLPVSWHVDHGPALVKDGKLELADVPTNATWPLTVEVMAWQYGSAVPPEVQSAEPVRRTIRVVR